MAKIFSEDNALLLAEKLLQNDKKIKTELEEKINSITVSGGNHNIDLSEYVTKNDLEEYAYKDHEHEQYLTEHQDLSDYAKTSDIPDVSNLATTEYVDNAVQNVNVNLDGYATEEYVTSKINEASLSGEEIDLSDYALKSEIPTDYLSSIPDEYVTEIEMNAAIANAQLSGGEVNLNSYYTKDETYSKTEIDDAINNAQLSGADGASAYEVALNNGFEGTEEEWLESLKGEKGDGADVKSTYEYAVDGGYNGTEEEFTAVFGSLSNSIRLVEKISSDNKFDNVYEGIGQIDFQTGLIQNYTETRQATDYREIWEGFDGILYFGTSTLLSGSGNCAIYFYDKDKNYLGYVYSSADTSKAVVNKYTRLTMTPNGTSTIQVDTLRSAKYYRIMKPTSGDVQLYVSHVQPTSADTMDFTYTTITVAESAEEKPADEWKKLAGKTVVNFGDSIFGQRRPPEDISTYLARITGATVHNCGFGGCHMSNHWGEIYNPFSMCNLADSISSGDWTAQENALTSSELPGYFAEAIAILKSLDFSKVDIITIAYGTNDWNSDDNMENNNDLYSKDTFAGALRYSIEKLLTAYPNLKIFICSQTYRWFPDDNGNFIEDSDTKENGYKVKLTDYVAKTEEIAKAYHLPFIDNYYSLGFNKFNRSKYFKTTDGTHPLPEGNVLIAEHMANELF